MGEPLRPALAVVVLVGGVAMIGCSIYLQCFFVPRENTVRHVAMRVALVLGGLALILLGRWLLR